MDLLCAVIFVCFSVMPGVGGGGGGRGEVGGGGEGGENNKLIYVI